MMLTVQEKVSCHSADLLFDRNFSILLPYIYTIYVYTYNLAGQSSCFKLPLNEKKIHTQKKACFWNPFILEQYLD